ncbi:MAG TPA: CPBP family intramembrane glutamic endopeptidase [Acidimicrobiales bacterium]
MAGADGVRVGGDDGDGRRDDSPPLTIGDATTWLFIAAVGFVGGQILSAIILFAVAAVNGHLSDLSTLAALTVPPAWVVVCGLVGLWIGFIGAAVMASRMRGTGSIVRDMGLSFRRWDPLIGIGAGLFGQFVLVELLYLPWEHFDPGLSQKLQQPAQHLTGGFPGFDLVVIGVLTVGVVPVVEELFFRGLVLRGFLRLFRGAGRILGPGLAVTLTGIVFGLAHVELLELLGLASFGIVLSVMAYKFKRLGPGIFAHATFNGIAITAIAHQGGMIH